MKPFLHFAIFVCIVFASCTQPPAPQQHETPKEETPKALKTETSGVSLGSRRGTDDLVESIYKELTDKSPALQQLEEDIKNLEESKGDSTSAFDAYNGKNAAYYLAAGSHLATIKDSALRDKMKQYINISQADYNSSTVQHKGLLNTIAAKEATLDDIHTVLKLMTTLRAVIHYQRANLPPTKPMEGLIKQYDNTTELADNLAKK
jgi:hypothetical protein